MARGQRAARRRYGQRADEPYSASGRVACGEIRAARVRGARPWLLLLQALGLSVACGGATTPSRAPEGPALVRYTFSLDEERESLTARVCFEGAPPRRMRAIHSAGEARRAETEIVGRDGRARPLPAGREVAVPGLQPGECVRYRVDLRPGGQGLGRTFRVDDDVVAGTPTWLWAFEPRPPDGRTLARFELPEGVRVSAVWPDAAEPGWLEVGPQAFRFVAHVAFGTWSEESIAVPSGTLEVVSLGAPLGIGPEGRANWLGAAASATAQVGGAFPEPRTSVLLVPRPGSVPVPFGIVGRGVIPSVMLLVDPTAEVAALRSDWTAVHEFAHLLSPHVELDEAWLGEGLATYYQAVLRAREGLLTPEEAWKELLDGFRRGQAAHTGRSLRQDAAEMGLLGAYARVYWAGAAIALLADVAYREEGDSLDAAMVRASGARGRALRANELIALMDGREDGPLARVATVWVERADFPDVGEVLGRLGVARRGALVHLGDAPEAAIRAAIMNEPRGGASYLPRGE